jgi:protein SCO1/2
MTTDHRRLLTGLATAVLCSAVAGCSGGDATDENPAGVIISEVDEGEFYGAEPVTPYAMPDVTLTATNNQPFNLVTDTAYPTTLVFFGYTNCAEVCRLVMSDLTSAYLRLPEAVRDETQVVYITTDPARDTPPVLRDYLERYDASFVGLTGDLGDIVTAANAMGVPIEGREKLPDGGYDVGHGAQVLGFHDNEADVLWTEGTAAAEMAHDITELSGR